ncbi:MAG TPA: RNA methyltransferase [Bacillota bacterium]|nr:MAG: putative TrmH family tRNA/rRNA methyltransferase [Firmicutes bacterium ADurb.Bin153]HNV35325.1 RNA methyltransferase [Bacillota bacterium]
MITSRSNDKIKRYRSLLARPEEGLVCLEGQRLVADSVDAGARLVSLFVSPRAHAVKDTHRILEGANESGAEVIEVSEDILEYMCDTEHPRGIAAVAAWAPAVGIGLEKPVVALDGVQDPGNVGTIIRSAAAFGYGAVLLGGETARAYSPKVARASMGSIYRLDILHLKNLAGSLQGLKDCGCKVYGLDMDGEPVDGIRFAMPYCLVVGSEAEGLSDGVRTVLDGLVSVPMKGSVESLNAAVASSIAMWAASKGVLHG